MKTKRIQEILNKQINTYPLIEYKIDSDCWRDDFDSTCYVTDITANIFIEEDYEKFKVGLLKATIIHITEAIKNDMSLEDLLDGHSIEISDYSSDFFDFRRNMIKRNFFNSSDDYDFQDSDILIINEISLNKKGRGRGLSKKIIKDLEFIFGKNKLIILKPFPLQFCKDGVEFTEMDYDDFSKDNLDFDISTKKIKDIYKKIGYKSARGTDLLFKHG